MKINRFCTHFGGISYRTGRKEICMIAIPITEVKPFMNKLLRQDVFDQFHVTEISLTTCGLFTIDGHVRRAYYTKEEYEELYEDGYPLMRWGQVRPYCYDLIRGTHTPLAFSIVFQLSKSGTTAFLSRTDSSFSTENINGLFLNLSYKEGKLTAVTGISLNIFSLDRTLESSWDCEIQKFINSL